MNDNFGLFGLTLDQLQVLLQASLKPDEIENRAPGLVQHNRVRELLGWFYRYANGDHANPKWLAAHAMELAYYIATEGADRGIDLNAIRDAAFKEGFFVTTTERLMLTRVGFNKDSLT